MLRLLQKKYRPLGLVNSDLFKYGLMVTILHIVLSYVVFQPDRSSCMIDIKKNLVMRRATRVMLLADSIKKTTKKSSFDQTIQKKDRREKIIKKLDKKLNKQPAKKLFSPLNLGSKRVKSKKIKSQNNESSEQKIEPIKLPTEVSEIKPSAMVPVELDIRQYEEAGLYADIIDAVKRWWHPPVGVSTTTPCSIQVSISSTGAPDHLEVIQSSGFPVYDIAAKSAVLKSHFPKKLWGKKCIFQF